MSNKMNPTATSLFNAAVAAYDMKVNHPSDDTAAKAHRSYVGLTVQYAKATGQSITDAAHEVSSTVKNR